MVGEEHQYKTPQCASTAQTQLISSMKLNTNLVCKLAFLTLYCVLHTVKKSDGTYVPGRCLCPKTQPGVRGQLKDLLVLQKSASCSSVTVIVTMKRNNAAVCLNPAAPMGKQLIRCWNRAHKLGRDVKPCLRRRRRMRGGQQQRPQQRKYGQNKKS